MVYCKYNQALKERYDCRDVIDPIMLNDIDESNEWLLGKFGEGNNAENDLVHEDDDLTWGVISEAMGAEDPIVNTRSTSESGFKSMSRRSVSGVGASSSRRREPEPEEEEFDSEDESEEENAQIDYGSYGEEEEEFDLGDEDDDE